MSKIPLRGRVRAGGEILRTRQCIQLRNSYIDMVDVEMEEQ